MRVGTSGWSYDDWDGRFYPDEVARTRWFDHYAGHFPTVEINYSFYRLPRQTTVEKWHGQAPDRFRYAVKGSRYITHNLKLGGDVEDAIGNVVRRMAPLKTFLGVWLWQLPPNLHKDVERLDRFLSLLPGSDHAVEFRHRSWWDEEVEETLRRHDAAFVWLSDSDMPDARPLTSDTIYVRLHGKGEERYRYDYSDRELEEWAARLRALAADGHDAWVFFNNDHRAKAPKNAATLVELLGDAAEPWP